MVIDVDEYSSGSEYVEEDSSSDSSEGDWDSDKMDMDDKMDELGEDETETVIDTAAVARDLMSTVDTSANSFDL